MIRSAGLSSCQRYRYWLRRSWSGLLFNGKVVCFVMLNPSTADAEKDDPTIRRCISFAKSWGYSELIVRNLFSLRSADPGKLIEVEDPVGPEGDKEVALATCADLVVVAWGANVPFDRDREVVKTLLKGVPLYCLGTTISGSPRHPLYVKADQPLIDYQHRGVR